MRQRHYVNRVGPGETGFFTTTALDFSHLFRRPEMREAMTLMMLRYFLREQVRLHAFAMMSHHLHFVATMPPGKHGNDIVQVLKSSSARKLRPLLLPEELEALAQQDGLNRHNFWRRGYRSTRLFTSAVRQQKIDYTHANPVRASYVEDAKSYRWSSAWAWELGEYVDDDFDLRLDRLIEFYQGSA